MNCNNCNKEKHIVNKHFNLCFKCNNNRLQALKSNNGTNVSKHKNKSFKKPKIKQDCSFVKNFVSKKTTKQKIKEDNEFYKKCFDSCEVHQCEECGCDLPNQFLIDGKVAARWRYSHIIPKSIANELRHDINNINHLCLLHHAQWENGDKESMKIYEKNKKRLPKYF